MIGHRESSIPFSYVDENKQPIGYSLDICAHVAEAIKNSLGLPSMKVQYKAVTPSNCRQKDVAFSFTTFVAANRLLSKKSSNIRILLNLKNKTVVSTAGTTALRQLKEMNTKQSYNMNILEGKDHAESFAMVEDDRAAAFSMDDILLASLVANAKRPADYVLSVQALSVEPYGIMMRRDDPELKKAVDNVILSLFRGGEIRKLYAKWFQAPIPPKGVNLNLPMGETLEHLLKKPSDSGNPATYH